jgi:Ca2+-binding RTX toxin-like protein
VNTSTLTKPIAGVTALAVVLASLLAFFAFDARPAGAQTPDITINPINVELGDLAEGEVKTTTITITNPSDAGGVVNLGEIDLNLGEGVDLEDLTLSLLDLDGNELVDLSGVSLTDLLGDVLSLPDDPDLDLAPGETVQLVLGILPTALEDGVTEDINLTLELLNGDTSLGPVIQVGGEARACTIEGTEGSDPALAGTQGNDVICAKGGDDRVTDVGGNDIIFAGEGSDQVDAGPGKDKVYAGTGNNGAAEAEKNDADTLNGEGGRDRLDTKDGEANDTPKGGPGKDKLVKDRGEGGKRR